MIRLGKGRLGARRSQEVASSKLMEGHRTVKAGGSRKSVHRPPVTPFQISSCCAACHRSTLHFIQHRQEQVVIAPAFLLHIVETGTCLFMCTITRHLHTGYLLDPPSRSESPGTCLYLTRRLRGRMCNGCTMVMVATPSYETLGQVLSVLYTRYYYLLNYKRPLDYIPLVKFHHK